MSWLRALRETARAGLTIERRRLEPLIAIRGAAGLALVIGVGLAFFGPVVAASSAFGAFQAAIATFQRSWRPRPVLALVSGAPTHWRRRPTTPAGCATTRSPSSTRSR